MEQEINYGGHSTTPSDYVSKDGDLAVAVNLLNENGSVGVVLPPKVMRQLPSDTAAVYVHDTAKMKHYILVLSNGDIYWADAEGLWGLEDTGYNIRGIEKVVPLGNTLCILSESGMDYLLWKDGEGEYKRLSPNLPEIKLSFGLALEMKSSSSSAQRNRPEDYDGSAEYWVHWDSEIYPKSQEFLDDMTTCVHAAINKIEQNCREENKFTQPFFVRYAYRLFDGSYTMQSAPILMIPTTGHPIVSHYGGFNGTADYYYCMMPVGTLETGLFDATVAEELQEYKDVIRSIDIFVSRPLYTYDPNEKFSEWGMTEMYEYSGWGIGRVISRMMEPGHSYVNPNSFPWEYARRDTLYTLLTYDDSNSFCRYYIKLRNNTTIARQIDLYTTFYNIGEIPIQDIGSYVVSPSFYKLPDLKLADGILQGLETRITLIDDYNSHTNKTADYLYSYNLRLQMANLREELFDGYYNNTRVRYRIEYTGNLFDPDRIQVVEKTDPVGRIMDWECYVHRQGDFTSAALNDMFKAQEVYVWIKKNGKDYVVKETIGGGGLATMGSFASMTDPTTPEGRGGDITIPWFYYPDTDAYCARIRMYREDLQQWFHYKVNLKPHDMLNGAYYFGNFAWQPLNISSASEYTPTADNWIEQPNKLYTSEVLNPWYFPVEGIVTVGNGEVKALAAATQALSQGQFGQFPLYAFCSDGVWALTVGQTGFFTSSHPVSRDVCTNPDGVTQIDSAVIYPTERGLMLLVGSTNKCFTDELYDKGETTIVNTLTGMDELLTKAELTRAVLPEVSFIEYMEGCKMVYDYVRQRITVYNPSRYPASPGQTVGERKYKYAYVYSLKTNKWGMVESNLEWTTNSYPEALAMTDDKKLVDVSGERGSSAKVKGLLVTRPLKLGDGDIYKSIHTMIQRGMFERGDVGCVLWGSRDLYHWYLVGSSKTHELRMLRGTGYKYYRIGLLVDLPESKSVSRATIELEGRNMNVVR